MKKETLNVKETKAINYEPLLPPVIGVVTPYKRDFEFWKQDKGYEKYGKNVKFVMLRTIQDVVGRSYKTVEMGYRHNKVHVDVVNAAVVRIR